MHEPAIYSDLRRGKFYHTVVWYAAPGERRKRSFRDKGRADAEFLRVKKLLNTGTASLLNYKTEDVTAFLQTIAPFPVTLYRVAKFYADAHKHGVVDSDVAHLVAVFFQTRENRSKRYRETLNTHFKKFVLYFGTRQLQSITPEELDQYLTAYAGTSPRTRLGHYTTLKTLYTWARNHDHLPYGIPTAIERVDKPIVTTHEHQIYAPIELLHMLAVTPVDLLPWIVLSAWGFVRSSESLRLEWTHYDEVSNILKLGSDITKTARRRVVNLPENIRAWMPLLNHHSARIVPTNELYALTPLLRKRGVKLVSNGLRASCASYYLEKTKSADQTSKNTGHSKQVLETEYLNLVSPIDAEYWFSIIPQDAILYAKSHGLVTPEWVHTAPASSAS